MSAPLAFDAADEARFCAFYRSTRDSVARALALTVGDADLAAEATDEALARAFQRWATVGAMANPAGWVYRVAFNWACTRLRVRQRSLRLPVADDQPGIGPIGEPAVARALAELDVRHRAVVVCRYRSYRVLYSRDGTTWSVDSLADLAGGPVAQVGAVLVTDSKVVVTAIPPSGPTRPADHGTVVVGTI